MMQCLYVVNISGAEAPLLIITLQIYYLWQNSARIKTIIFVRESPKAE